MARERYDMRIAGRGPHAPVTTLMELSVVEGSAGLRWNPGAGFSSPGPSTEAAADVILPNNTAATKAAKFVPGQGRRAFGLLL
jgi:hypothetical protein